MTSAKKIAILTPSYLPETNGMSYAAEAYVKICQSFGMKVLVCTQETNQSRDLSTSCDIFIERLNITGSGVIGRPVKGDTEKLELLLRQFDPELIIVNGQNFWGHHLIPKLSAMNVKIQLISHGSVDLFVRGLPFTTKLIRALAYCHYENIVLPRIKPHIKKIAMLSNHVDRKRFRDHAIYNGIDAYTLPNLAQGNKIKQDTLNPKCIKLVCVGRTERNKNQLAIFKLISRNNNIKQVDLYYPEKNPYLERFKKIALIHKEVEFNYFEGLDRQNIVDKLPNYDFSICLSLNEAQPLTLLDSIACGVPFLSVDVGCVSTFQGGIVGDIEKLKKILATITVPEYNILAKSGPKFIQERHSYGVLRSSLKSFLET